MIDSYFRNNFDKALVTPLINKIQTYNIDPTTITLLACLSGISVAPFIVFHYPLLAVIMLVLSGYLDTLDGSLARAQNSTSSSGAVLDILSDRIVEFAVVLGLFLVSPETRGLVSILMLGSILICVTSFLVVGIFEKNEGEKSFHYSPGIMERAEAFLFFSLMILLPSQFLLLGTTFTVLVLLTALVRVYQFRC